MHTYHGFPFHEFQNPLRRAAYVAIERRLARITDTVLAIGSGVATEALRRGLATPSHAADDRSRRGGGHRAEDRQHRGRPHAPSSASDRTTPLGRHRRTDRLSEGAGAPDRRDGRAPAYRRHGRLDRFRSRRREAKELVRRAGLSTRFVFAGERSDVARLLPAFDVFAMASRYEGLPCAVVEAMRCGVPVVATAVNSVPDLVVPGESGVLVPPGRPELLADAIDDLLDDPAKADRLAGRGRISAGSTFDAEGLAEVLDQVYSGHRRAELVAS